MTGTKDSIEKIILFVYWKLLFKNLFCEIQNLRQHGSLKGGIVKLSAVNNLTIHPCRLIDVNGYSLI